MSTDNTPTYFTVDGASTRDIDDALSVRHQPDGSFQIKVAIANPLAHIPKGGKLDVQAKNLAASVYMRSTPLHRMLPASISEERASLVAGSERQAFVFSVDLSSQLDVLKFEASDEPITVGRRLSFDDIPNILADSSDALQTDLIAAVGLSSQLLAKRRQRGALALYDMAQLLLTDEEGNLQQHDNKAEVMGNILVQEMMILVNSEIGSYLAKHNVPAIFRNHRRQVSAPESGELANLVQSWMQGDFDMGVVQSQFSAIAGKASYGHQIEGHYGLGLPVYVHASSPLRRYADLVNLRQLAAHLRNEDLPYSLDALQDVAQSINTTIDRQKEARAEGYKQGLKRVVSREMERGNLSTLADHELSAAVKMSGLEGVMPDALEAELVRRVKADTLAFEVAQRLFFKTPGDVRTPAVTEALVAWLDKAPHRAPSLISAGIMLGTITGEPEIHTENASGQFHSAVSVHFKEAPAPYLAVGNAPQKKLSIQKALVNALCQSIGVDRKMNMKKAEGQKDSKPRADQGVGPVETPAQSVAPSSVPTYPSGSNPKGQLMEWCQKAKSAMPVFTHSTAGPSHKPVFGVSVELVVDGQPYQAQAQGLATKKLAEAQASWQLLQTLLGTEREQVNDAPPAKLGAENPISVLQEWCQRQHLALPEYQFQRLAGNTPMFSCTVTVPTLYGEESFVGRAGTKQGAKAAAAESAVTSGALEKRVDRPRVRA